MLPAQRTMMPPPKMLAGKPFTQEEAGDRERLISSEAAMDNSRDATQIPGGYGVNNIRRRVITATTRCSNW